jgi:hypothetical protein
VNLDLDAIFTGNNPQEVLQAIVTVSNVDANSNSVCAEPSGCFENSVCIYATIWIVGTSETFSVVSCGNTVSNARTLVDE